MIVLADAYDDEVTGYTARERAIFAYHLGAGRPAYRGDPLAIADRYEVGIEDEGSEVVSAYTKVSAPVHQRLIGYGKLSRIACQAFDLPPFAEDRPDGLAIEEALRLLNRFFAWHDLLTKRYRREAELLVTYGPVLGRPRSYEREVGLWFNRSRAQGFAAVAQWRGAMAASGRVRVDHNLVDAMSPSSELATELDERLEADRVAQSRQDRQARSR